jgi:uncharacterized protein
VRRSAFIIFLSIVFTVHLSVNYYIFIRGWQALLPTGVYKSVYIVVVSLLFISYPASRFLDRSRWVKISEPFLWIGSLWFAAMLYYFVAIVLIDLVRLLDHWFIFLPEYVYCPCSHIGQWLFIYESGAIFLLIAYGFMNARNPVIKKLSINIPGKSSFIDELNIAMVSDIHIGMLIKHRMVGRLAKMIKSINPDVVLFAGDILDEVVDPVVKYNLAEPLRSINAPLGLYAITGNHEFIGGAKRSVAYIELLGIKVLMDEAVVVAHAFNLLGRIDRDGARFGGERRKELPELMKGIDTSLPIILMDHQPFHLDQSEANGIDLHLSGHTHHGQIWPFNYITKAIYKLSWGYLKKGNTHYYVSFGYGSWGPPVRIGNRPEVVQINITFQ